ncbi:MAG: U32 family peptidase [Kiritimatiellae bacterium]|nr:U32 family peptidase [Kiritimatiellia bacterium]
MIYNDLRMILSPELLAPAGSLDAALAAFRYGADAVYLGLPRFSARAEADNLTVEKLRVLLAYARSLAPAKKIYVTFNTLVMDSELAQAVELLDTLDDLAPDGVIVQDLGVARVIREHFPSLALHASTQMAAHNPDGARALANAGFSRVVLARELTIKEMAEITRSCGIETEVFIHGALCYSVSGLCLFSSVTSGRSGNRGRCAYCCREAFTKAGCSSAAASAESYPFSMRDLCLAPVLGQVVAAGVSSLKIEGRMKSPLYVASVTDYYRRKLDGRLTPDDERALAQDLQTVFSRPWTSLYAEGPETPPDKIIDPNFIGHRGALIGHVQTLIRERDGTRWLRLTTERPLEKHDGIQVEQTGGGKPFGFAVNRMRQAGGRDTAITQPAGSAVDIALPDGDLPPLPPGAPVFCAASQAVRRRYTFTSLREADLCPGRPADIEVILSPAGITAKARAQSSGDRVVAAETSLAFPLAPSRQPDQTRAAVLKCFERTGGSGWRLGKLTVEDPQGCYAPPSKLNGIRRALLDRLTAAWDEARALERAGALNAICRDPARSAANVQPERAVNWTLKLRVGSPLPSPACLRGIGAVVLGIGHSDAALVEAAAETLRAAGAERGIALALPLLTRAHEAPALRATVSYLIGKGWRRWECADLAGVQMLADFGMRPWSADWSLYALNRCAARELAAAGCRRFVLSPEIADNEAAALAQAIGTDSYAPETPVPVPEFTVYRHTPLFISETAPCFGKGCGLMTDGNSGRAGIMRLTDRRGRSLICHKLDNRWITTLADAFCVTGNPGTARFTDLRVDLSWSPEGTDIERVITATLAGRGVI